MSSQSSLQLPCDNINNSDFFRFLTALNGFTVFRFLISWEWHCWTPKIIQVATVLTKSFKIVFKSHTVLLRLANSHDVPIELYLENTRALHSIQFYWSGEGRDVNVPGHGLSLRSPWPGRPPPVMSVSVQLTTAFTPLMDRLLLNLSSGRR